MFHVKQKFMKCVIKFPSDFKFIVDSYDVPDLVEKLQCPITVLSVVDNDEEKDDRPGYHRTMLTIVNPNCPGSGV